MPTEVLEDNGVIERLKLDLIDAETEVARIKKKLEYYGAMPYEKDVPNIHWRNSIRKCLIGKGINAFLMTSNEIVKCVCAVNSVSADRNIKTKISTSLGLMHNQGEIGRLANPKNPREFMYGLKEHFLPDLKTLKDEYLELTDGRTIPLGVMS